MRCFRNRLGALLTWWLAFARDVRRERTFTTQQIETLHDVYALPLAPDADLAAPALVPDNPAAAAAARTGMRPAPAEPRAPSGG
jgi:hypothetical protein